MLQWTVAVTLLLLVATAMGEPASAEAVRALAERLQTLYPHVLPPARREAARTMLPDDLKHRLQAANDRSSDDWRAVRTLDDWQRFRDERMGRLLKSLGPFPKIPASLDLRVTGTQARDGYHVDNLIFQSRPGLWVTANLYRPAKARKRKPALLLCHSHHAPKEQGELQDMGATWARHGCLVLVPDLLGHGERRQHPFASAADYDGDFRVGRQDYYFRYDMGMQMHLAGESLMGWLVWDLWRCVDLLLAQPDVDPKRVVLLGAVAGGGDPAAVAAALDPRIAVAVPFNFGGAQPETRYPLPDDAEKSFNYAGSGSFESTRNLHLSAAEGFLPWAIVASVAPRGLIYGHEFAWDRERDPVWRRLERVWGLFGARDHLAAVHGSGSVKGRPPESTHCTNIGPVHRAGIHAILRQWCELETSAETEYSYRLPAESLQCMTPELERELKPKRLCDLLSELAARRVQAARSGLRGKPQAERRRLMREAWAGILGEVEPRGEVQSESLIPADGATRLGTVSVEQVFISVEPGISIPMLMLLPGQGGRRPCVVAVAQAGKAGFLKHRARELAELVTGGAAVCLPDLRGIGETRPEGDRERWGSITAQSSTELMLGSTLVGARLRDLRAVIGCLRARKDIDGQRLALWGDSFAAVNPPDRRFEVPRNVDGRPAWCEPLGGLLALLAALFEDDVAAVYVRGGLSDFHSVLGRQCVYIPIDVVIPGLLNTCDLPDLAASVAPCPLRLDALVDGLNRQVAPQALATVYEPARAAYRTCGVADRFSIGGETPSATDWLLGQLRVR